MRSRIFFVISTGFVFGIFIRSLYTFSAPFIGIALLIAIILLGGWFAAHRKLYLFIGIWLCAISLGMVRVAIVPNELPHTFMRDIGETITLSGTVVSTPDIRDTTQRFIVYVSKDRKSTGILAVTSLAQNVSYGAHIILYGKLSLPVPFHTKHSRIFHYDKYLAGKGAFAIMQHASIRKIIPSTSVWSSVYNALGTAKQMFLRALDKALPEPSASLAGGLVAGGTRGLGAPLLNDFIRSGLIHIVVLSGYNVMIVAEAVLAALSFLQRKRAIFISSIIIAAFVIAAGAGAASIRAGIMAILALLASATGRVYDVVRALLIAVILMLIWNPLLIVDSIGFDLSVIATLGLIFGMPIIEPYFVGIKNTFLRETIAATTAAQISVLPLLLYSNGLFSLVAFVANVLVLPLVPAAMAASAFAGFVGLTIPMIAPYAGLPAYVLLHSIITIVHTAANLPFVIFSIPTFSFLWVLGTYAVLIFFIQRHISATNNSVRIENVHL